jgi:hypothetical protein
VVVWVARVVKVATRLFLAATFCAAFGFHLDALGGLSAVTTLLSVHLFLLLLRAMIHHNLRSLV